MVVIAHCTRQQDVDLGAQRGGDQTVEEGVVGRGVGAEQELALSAAAGDQVELAWKHLSGEHALARNQRSGPVDHDAISVSWRRACPVAGHHVRYSDGSATAATRPASRQPVDTTAALASPPRCGAMSGRPVATLARSPVYRSITTLGRRDAAGLPARGARASRLVRCIP
jgi:hypothetical protein